MVTPKSNPGRTASIVAMSRSLQRTLRAEGKSENTVYSYLLSARLLSEYLDERGHDLTVDVAKYDIRDFIAEQGRPRLIVDSLGRKHRSGSPATALVRFKSLQQFFRHCVEEGELEASPMAGMRAPKTDDVPVAIVGDEILTALLKARSGKSFVNRRDAAILRVFLDTGCRLAEITNLRFSDIDLDGQTIRVVGKGKKIRRSIFGLKTAQAIDRYLRVLERDYPERMDVADGHLWIGRQGPMSTSGITGVLHRMCSDAGVPRLHWHQLRHTFAHQWLANGGNEGDLMSLAGWDSRSMLDRYAKSAQVERAHAAGRRMSLGDRV
jgi:site-specific recombinase XerD